MNAWLTKVHPKIDNPHPNFKEICWYIDYLSILLPLQTAYYTKLSNFPELINHLHWHNGVRIIPPTKTPPRKTSPTENSPVENFPCSKSTAGNFPSGLNEDSLFYSGFSGNKPLVWGSRFRDWRRFFYNL